MRHSRDDVLRDLIGLLHQLAGDWEYEGPITEQTQLVATLGLESLDLVVLGTAVQEHYREIFPFSEFFAALGQRAAQDVTVGEWADFIAAHLGLQHQVGMV